MKELLHWCGPAMFDLDSVPWKTPVPKPQPKAPKAQHGLSKGSDAASAEAAEAGGAVGKAPQVPEVFEKTKLQKKREYDKQRLSETVKA
jgi:hypothetical protein